MCHLNKETGLNLPDVSIMPNLCEILGISLNELFAGEYLKEKEVKKQSEKNILDILKFSNYKDKKYKFIIFIILILLIISVFSLGEEFLIRWSSITDKNLKYSQEYIAGTGNIKGDVDIKKYENISSDFAIGANIYGYAVFKNPEKALERLMKNYDKGINLIKKEYNLAPLTKTYYRLYGKYGWQVTTGTEEERTQASFVSSFIDTYENSFNPYISNLSYCLKIFKDLILVIFLIMGIYLYLKKVKNNKKNYYRINGDNND